MAVALNTMSPQVLSRLEDPTGVFWSQQYEVYTALAEALNDLMLLIGRPTQVVNQPLTLTANTAWQSLPTGVMAITDIYGTGGRLWKCTLSELDYVQSSWTNTWECDTDDNGPRRWAPLGFGGFVVHPTPTVPVSVTYTGVQYPMTVSWPYAGTETIPFHDEMMTAIEEYAAHYCRIKDGQQDFQQSLTLFKSYLTAAQRLTQISDRRDPFIFTVPVGGQAGTNQLAKR